MNGIFKTPIANNNCAAKPSPTVLQLIAFLLLLSKIEMTNNTTIPKTPRIKLFAENPSLEIIAVDISCAKVGEITKKIAATAMKYFFIKTKL